MCEELVQSSANFHFVDYMNISGLGPQVPLQEWGAAFNRYVRQQSGGRRILVGYSLGGRLAMQAFKQDPDLWQKVILISANPGFTDLAVTDRQQRMVSDQKWAQKFQTENWSQVMQDWNGQPVFAGNKNEPARVEQNYSKEQLAHVLTEWSLARQLDMRSFLSEYKNKLVWVSGEQDEKFVQLAQTLQKEIGPFAAEVIPLASHRVLFDQPSQLAKVLSIYLQ